MITISNINYRYTEISAPWVLHGIDLTIQRGEYVLLCGKSGSGKSTLGYLLNGLIPHFFGGTLEGTVSILGQNTHEVTVGDLISTVGLVFQNADAQLFNSTVGNEIAFGLESLGLPAQEIRTRTEKTATALGIRHLLERSPLSLSGGEKRLATIASILCLDPPVIVLDEPLAHLDWEGADKVRAVLYDLHRKGTTLVVIEQRIDALLKDGTRCVILNHGEIIFDGPAGAAQPALAEQHLLPHYPQKEGKPDQPQHPLVQVRQVSYAADNNMILRDVSLEVNHGEILAIVGRNGAGKTTLVKLLNGLLRPAGGNVLFREEEIHGKAPSEIAARIGISFQNPNDQFFKSTVKDELTVGLKPGTGAAEAWFNELCTLFELHELLGQSPYRLSEGQKKRVAIASILVMNPELLVLDEPTTGQDGHFLEVLAGLLMTLRRKGLTIVIVTHDLEFAFATADRWLVVHNGKVLAEGTPQTLADSSILVQMGTRGVEDRILTGGSVTHAHSKY